jgi:hypothetical protein
MANFPDEESIITDIFANININKEGHTMIRLSTQILGKQVDTENLDIINGFERSASKENGQIDLGGGYVISFSHGPSESLISLGKTTKDGSLYESNIYLETKEYRLAISFLKAIKCQITFGGWGIDLSQIAKKLGANEILNAINLIIAK